MSYSDRRKHQRARLGQRCWCECGSITIYAVIHDVSEGGLFVRTSAPLYEGARTRVRWSLGPDEDEIEVDAVVVWRRVDEGGSQGPSGMGLRIEQIEPHGQERIRNYVMSVVPSPAP